MKLHRNSFPTISEVASRFGVSRTKVFNLLRSNDVIGSQGLVRALYKNEGYFKDEERSRFNPALNRDMPYHVVTVTPKGQSLIQDLLDAAGIETPNRHHDPRVQQVIQNAG